ncbi:phage tail sheath C-terminal domain-containing protein [Vitiosangium sp. GDMCC 1.1324]|uniref:phage tail sheath family protein n=1 Tax=Vitiosangium sp. (strain GDMCC 1.1324) TaxID=2138576 RepID=UPI000D3468DF|nr:phage tail sheath C-terminal domain-containing protein [Vitiosangium sp. GDMCC 1.1324]PTL79511.1 phage tail protein [Vitiosangium sp. GDMCC 1.1324]
MALVRPPLSAPGVYVQEVPSGVRTIIGVSTSLTVFLGRTERGPVNQATRVSSWEEFEQHFGGLLASSPMTYAVQDFFLNGGAQALILRLFNGDPAAATAAIPFSAESGRTSTPTALDGRTPKSKKDASDKEGQAITGNYALKGQSLVASSPGTWASGLSYSTDTDGLTSPELDANGKPKAGGKTLLRDSLVTRYATRDWPALDLFNLTVTYTQPNGQKSTERFSAVSLHDNAGSRRLDRVLQQSSLYTRLSASPGTAKDSDPLTPANYAAGLDLLDQLDLYNIVCIPPETFDGNTDINVYSAAAEKCSKMKATLILDPPTSWTPDVDNTVHLDDPRGIGITPADAHAPYCAVYFPRVTAEDPLQGGAEVVRPASGIIAGIIARTDATRGVWKAPAGYNDGGLSGITGLQYALTDTQNGQLNSLGVNCLRSFSPVGPVVWGARTLAGADVLSSDFKYLPVRRLTDYIEQTLLRQTRWAVFEPNDEPLWSQLRLAIGSFMNDLFRQGAFQGSSRDQAFFVKCDSSTTTQDDINRGIVNVEVGFAPLKPAEFVVIYIEQKAGQTA